MNNYLEKYAAFVINDRADVQVLKFGENEEIEIKVNPILTFEQRISFIKSIVGIVIGTDGETGESVYSPEMYEFAKRYFTVGYCTDYKLPKDVGDAWLLLKYTDLYSKVYELCLETCDDVYAAATEELRYAKERMLRNSGVLGGLKRIIDNIGEQTKDISPESMQEMLSTFKELNLPQDATIDQLVDAVVNHKNGLENK